MNFSSEEQKRIADAQALIKAPSESLARLKKSKASVTDKIECITASHLAGVNAAKEKEEQLAHKVAAAIARGANDAELNRLEKQFADAAAEVGTAQQKGQSGSAVLAALESQLEALNNQIATAEADLAKAEKQARQVRAEILKDHWNHAAQALATVGAELTPLLPNNGFLTLKGFNVPVFAADGLSPPGSCINRDTLLKSAGLGTVIDAYR